MVVELLPDREAHFAGRVADFCPICRRVTAFTIYRNVRVYTVVVLAFVPVIRSERVLDHERVCEECGLLLPADPHLYDELVPQTGVGVGMLQARSNPEVELRYSKRLELEARMRAGGLQPEERKLFVEEPFLLLDPRLERFAGRKRLRALGRVLGILALVVLAGGGILTVMNPQGWTGVFIAMMVLVIVTILLLFYWAFSHLTRRASVGGLLENETYPLLARSLRPLKPDPREIREVLESMRARNLTAGFVLDHARLMEELERPAAT